MHRSFLTIAKGLLWGAAAVCSLQASSITYTVNNYTLSGGDPIYSVASDLTLNNLVLTQTFADSTGSVVPLFDSSGAPRTSLSTSLFSLNSASLNTVNAAHGALVSATLTGTLSQTNLSIVTSFGGTPVTVVVSPSFSALLPFADSTVNLNAVDSNGRLYAMGALDEAVVASPAVPEPGTFAIALIGVAGLAVVLRRRSRHLPPATDPKAF